MMMNVFLITAWILSTLNAYLVAYIQNSEKPPCQIPDSSGGFGIKQMIQNLPQDDREKINKFFRDLLFFHGFAYTLFGDKPVSIENYDLENPEKPELFRTSCCGYRTWEKYARWIPQENFIFLFYEGIGESFCEITLINKKAFFQIVDKHQEKFAEIFGSDITSEKLLNLLIQKRSLWNTPMKDRDDLIGILLGYGKINSELFQKKSEIMCRRGIKKRRMEPSPGYHSIDEELRVLNASLQSFSKEGRVSLHYMRLPSFVADPHNAETVTLRKKYSAQRKHITKKYSQGNFLEITFEQLYSTQPD